LHISQYNNAGLISIVSEEVATENAENSRCRRRQPHCHWSSVVDDFGTNWKRIYDFPL